MKCSNGSLDGYRDCLVLLTTEDWVTDSTKFLAAIKALKEVEDTFCRLRKLSSLRMEIRPLIQGSEENFKISNNDSL